MIDHFALALGHGLLAIALLRLALRGDVDRDPLAGSIADEKAGERKARSAARRRPGR